MARAGVPAVVAAPAGRARPARAIEPGIGIALAGGGPLGAIYEIGACAALDEAVTGLDMTRAGVYVGVSAGAVIASSLANGIGPQQLVRELLDPEGTSSFDPGRLMRPAFGEYVQRLTMLPRLVWEAGHEFVGGPRRGRLGASLQWLTRAVPPGLLDGRGVETMLRQRFSEPGCSNDFRELASQLFLVATDLDSATAVAFGSSGHDDVPISVAAQASASLPGLFPPVQIGGRDYVDGALLKTLHASVALRAGARLLFCVNPLVPVDADRAARRPGAPSIGRLRNGGLPLVLSQTLRAIVHSRMQVGMDRYRHKFPDADVLLFEPSRDDAEMFFANVFSYRERSRLCEHAYQRTRADLRRRRDELAPVLRRHGLALDEAVLADAGRTLLREAPEPPRASLAGAAAELGAALEALAQRLPRPRPGA